MRIVAHENSGGTTQYRLKKGSDDFDLNAAGVTKIEVVENGESIDSDGEFVSFSGSVITIAWGKLKAPGITTPTIWAYSPTYPEGEVIFGPGTDSSIHLSMMPDERPA